MSQSNDNENGINTDNLNQFEQMSDEELNEWVYENFSDPAELDN